MPRGDKSSYSAKQKRQAKHIEESYEKKGTSVKTAKKRAWATVNKISGGAQKSTSKGKTKAKKTKLTHKISSKRSASAKKAAAKRSPVARSLSAKKAAATKKRNKNAKAKKKV